MLEKFSHLLQSGKDIFDCQEPTTTYVFKSPYGLWLIFSNSKFPMGINGLEKDIGVTPGWPECNNKLMDPQACSLAPDSQHSWGFFEEDSISYYSSV